MYYHDTVCLWTCVYTRKYYQHCEERAASRKWPISSLEPIQKLRRCTRSQRHTARVRRPNSCSRSHVFCRLSLHDRYADWIKKCLIILKLPDSRTKGKEVGWSNCRNILYLTAIVQIYWRVVPKHRGHLWLLPVYSNKNEKSGRLLSGPLVVVPMPWDTQQQDGAVECPRRLSWQRIPDSPREWSRSHVVFTWP